MAHCRVYLFTYKRNELFQRAVKSLLDQTFTSWICEVHNDCPDDPFPGEFISSLNDQRFIMKTHTENLGAVASFNLAFAGCNEPYASILEDDNWWEPHFLKEMTAVMDNDPKIKVSWSNMALWREEQGNLWTDTRQTIWPDKQSQLFEWPQVRQTLGALHSNGAMLYRGQHASKYLVPPGILFNAVELIRERSFEHPIYLHGKPLANFAITLATARNSDPYSWIATQTMLVASFMAASPDKKKTMKESLAYHRAQRPVPTASFFLANMLILKNKGLYKCFTITDWLHFGKWLLGNGRQLNYIKRYIASQSDTYRFLLKQTGLRYREAEQNTRN
ncbi:glycosyltransferase [Mucilaginibacter sp. cycad4]|uniref:glycosyltransferase family 2 protein n=1 Tax=Mucilaginibacter sp. cycad4 TaxID=3342096 RepID=UPI002AAB7B3B|nr:glycosyltransferase [Mucilaginibacter gossypii]WPU98356.1 glycosyltransferase [Mucilaginibacter gossypii]